MARDTLVRQLAPEGVAVRPRASKLLHTGEDVVFRKEVGFLESFTRLCVLAGSLNPGEFAFLPVGLVNESWMTNFGEWGGRYSLTRFIY